MNTQIVTVSSKGQIDVIMLKSLKLPSAEEFEASLDKAHK